eukprot:TRINITY_DN14549_c0_g2_i1.p1 TRINITY_DN14549_c0_g2~~TRINITY_DN14549_c0_g2_i1.p1  ORF type:complete len:393 (+),score=54.63 TRINITY_DN14549_c0_g2_i1:130-1308(+)
MIRRPPRSTLSSSSAASDVYKRQVSTQSTGEFTTDGVTLLVAMPASSQQIEALYTSLTMDADSLSHDGCLNLAGIRLMESIVLGVWDQCVSKPDSKTATLDDVLSWWTAGGDDGASRSKEKSLLSQLCLGLQAAEHQVRSLEAELELFKQQSTLLALEPAVENPRAPCNQLSPNKPALDNGKLVKQPAPDLPTSNFEPAAVCHTQPQDGKASLESKHKAQAEPSSKLRAPGLATGLKRPAARTTPPGRSNTGPRQKPPVRTKPVTDPDSGGANKRVVISHPNTNKRVVVAKNPRVTGENRLVQTTGAPTRAATRRPATTGAPTSRRPATTTRLEGSNKTLGPGATPRKALKMRTRRETPGETTSRASPRLRKPAQPGCLIRKPRAGFGFKGP